MVDNINNCCRLCLGNNPVIPVFFCDGAVSVKDKLMECTTLEIAENDHLPSAICNNCFAELEVAHAFAVKCKLSDKKLRSLVLELQNKEAIQIEEPSDTKSFVELEIKKFNDSLEGYFSDNELNTSDFFIKKEAEYNSCIENDYEDDKYEIDEDDFPLKIKVECDEKKRSQKRKNIKKSTNRKSKKNNSRGQRRDLQCSTCGLKVVSASAMAIHARTHTGERPHKCPKCEKTFAIKGTLKEHFLRLHTNLERNFTCENCGKQFTRKKELAVHKRVHTGETPYACPYCPKSFSQHSTVVTHIRRHTGEKPYACKTCGKRFAGHSLLKSHLRAHSDERPYQCQLCEKRFKSRDSQLKHIQLHEGKKDHICDQCGVAFAAKGNLIIHIGKVHSEKSGQCNVCHKNFSNLANHMRIHTKDYQFQCQVCNRRFLRKCNLVVHFTKHSNAGKYKCDVSNCKKTFHMKSMLDFHVTKVHNKGPLVNCSHCSKTFFRVCDLSRHIKVKHETVISNN